MQKLDFSSKTVLVLGDIMVDHYVYGNVDRISPEAPVPVLHFTGEEFKLGGAANVAANIAALGAKSVLLGVVGNDDAGEKIAASCKRNNIKFVPIIDAKRPTTLKTRYISGVQQIMRKDVEVNTLISEKLEESILAAIERLKKSTTIDAIILQDYNKGLFTPSLISKIISFSKDQSWLISVDPKFANVGLFKEVDILKPNRKEFYTLAASVGISLGEIIEKQEARKIKERIKSKNLWVTLGKDGIYYHDENDIDHIVPTTQKNIIDVCGAGDAVMSILTLCHLVGTKSDEMAKIANIAGGIVCGKLGVVTIDINELNALLS